MQERRKETIIISLIAVVFVFIVMVLFYQFSVISTLNKNLEAKTLELQHYENLLEETNNQIQLVQTNDYVEKWAKTFLNWVGEGEIKFVI